MAGAGKSVIMIAHQLKRTVMAVRGRAVLLEYQFARIKGSERRWNDLAEDFCGCGARLIDIATIRRVQRQSMKVFVHRSARPDPCVQAESTLERSLPFAGLSSR